MTSLLRDDVAEPIQRSFSSTITSRPPRARTRATASPTTPAPITTHSTASVIARLLLVPCPGDFAAEQRHGRDRHLGARVLHLAAVDDVDQRLVLLVVDAPHRQRLENETQALGEHLLA